MLMFRAISFLIILWYILNQPLINASPILDDFALQGYHEILNENCGQEFFIDIYSKYDTFTNFLDKNPELSQKLFDIDQEFITSYDNALYGSPPIGYIDDTKSGKTKKKYFHFTEDYLHFLTKNYPEQISNSEEISDLLESLQEISNISRKKFEEVIESMTQEVKLSEAMHTEDGRLLILVKIVKYEPSNLAASNPHFDFSGLSFLFDNSDADMHESLMIAPYKENLRIEDFVSPNRKYKKDTSNSSLLLIPGLALRDIELPINPTPHGVRRQYQKRYAIIVFAMVPNIKLTYDEIKLKQIKFPTL